MKYTKLYYERMKKSFTPEEKLFFLEELPYDLTDYGVIIDFGCGDGTMAKCVDEAYRYVSNLHKPWVAAIDSHGEKAEENLKSLQNLQAEFYHSFEEYLHYGIRPIGKRILLILSSVLHECEREDIWELVDFCVQNTVDVVIRDMYFDYGFHEHQEVYERIFNALPSVDQESVKIILRKQEDAGELLYNRTAALYEYFLKYDFLHNNRPVDVMREREEWYFNNNAQGLIRALQTAAKRQDDWYYEIEYERQYVLPYAYDKVKKDFGYELRFPTHCQYILTHKEKEEE